MSAREWQPGDVARVAFNGREYVAEVREDFGTPSWFGSWNGFAIPLSKPESIRPLAVIDPEDREQVDRLLRSFDYFAEPIAPHLIGRMQAALREFANPTPPKPKEPTNPRAYVEDARENIWRLLADGDWVCTSGPDIGEYIDWFRLAERYGPLTISGVES